MRILIAGGTGAIGRQLVPKLVEHGDDVVVLSRSVRHRAEVEAAGARTVIADALDADRLLGALKDVAPDAVVDLLTAIPPAIDPRRIDRDMAATNKLRTTGTQNLIAAVKAAGVSRFLAESVAFAYDPAGDPVNPEGAALWANPPKRFAAAMDALREHERLIREAGGTVLRFGHLYGPGTAYAADGAVAQQVRAGKFPIVGGGTAVFSFVHVRDAARAVDAALRTDTAAVLNIVDNDPAPVSEWLPLYAKALGAKAPGKAPKLIARMLAGSYGVAFLTQMRGASNARAKEALDWPLEFPSWREGFGSLARERVQASVKVGAAEGKAAAA